MGACDFQKRAKGKTAEEAFRAAVDSAAWEHGHGGYTGTIAEKHEFQMMTVPAGMTAQQYINGLIEDCCNDTSKFPGFNPFEDKWGPAGCIKLAEGEWVFFGLASS